MIPPDAVILAAIPAEGISTMNLVMVLRKKRILAKPSALDITIVAQQAVQAAENKKIIQAKGIPGNHRQL